MTHLYSLTSNLNAVNCGACFAPPAGNVNLFIISSDPRSGPYAKSDLYSGLFLQCPRFFRNHREMYPIWFRLPHQSAARRPGYVSSLLQGESEALRLVQLLCQRYKACNCGSNVGLSKVGIVTAHDSYL